MSRGKRILRAPGMRVSKTSKYIGRFFKGQLIGTWTVAYPEVHVDEKSRAFIYCECRCGNRDYVPAHHLVKGRTTRCDKCNERLRNFTANPNWQGEGFVPKTLINQLSGSATARGIPYGITPSYANSLYVSQHATCALTGQSISTSDNSAKLVSLDPHKGYVEGNVAWVHAFIAPALKNTPANDFIQMCLDVAKKHQFK